MVAVVVLVCMLVCLVVFMGLRRRYALWFVVMVVDLVRCL